MSDHLLPALSFLVAESEPPAARARRRDSVGRSSGETYAALLDTIAPGARVTRVTPADEGATPLTAADIAAHDAVFLTGSPLHLYDDSPECRRIIAFMRDVFGSGVPSFGSCAGLQVAVVAAGGRVRAMGERREAGFARRIAPTAAGRDHPLLRGRPLAYDAPAIHTDEVAELPAGATLLAGNAVAEVQAAEIRHGDGVFWGVQYHPEIDLAEVAAALRRQAEDLIEHRLARDDDDVNAQAALVEALGAEPDRRDLAWRLGLDSQVTDAATRSIEIRNFIELLVLPARARRRR
ncbi:type 1 glutamine amidotransferase [Sphingomonas sp. BK580]|uniref:type 1 glutamine amidotransferase n=1 Tax=Sphingomonas sp. BK580 TaxID=2586972 RepID=UPI001813DF9A|nr:type 1 glutamine amidotransferase [Sphingomonas sp. BK580]MBB3693734.1 GMP synthase (glutamine-hydrolyzing) [Sphingomonas sp. BK580]